jgi:hypothetical protein
MNKSSHTTEFYKYKAAKYYKKYIDLKTINQNIQFGGTTDVDKPDWYDKYIKELDNIYDEKFIITGSGSVSIYLNYYNKLTGGKFNYLIPTLNIPNDADFLYSCKGVNYESKHIIKKYIRTQSPQRSVTYVYNDSDIPPTYIKSFDLTCENNIKYVKIDIYKLLSIEKLLERYNDEIKDNQDEPSDYYKEICELKIKMEQHKTDSDKLSTLEKSYNKNLALLKTINNKILTLQSKTKILNTLLNYIKSDLELFDKYIVEEEKPETNSSTDDKRRHVMPNPLVFPDGDSSDDDDLELETLGTLNFNSNSDSDSDSDNK